MARTSSNQALRDERHGTAASIDDLKEASADVHAKPRQQKMAIPVDPKAALYPLPVAIAYSGMSRSNIYRHLNDGTLRARKSGRTTLIEGDSLRALMANLPTATFRKLA